MGGGDGGRFFRCNMIRRRLRASVVEDDTTSTVFMGFMGAGTMAEDCMVAIAVVILTVFCSRFKTKFQNYGTLSWTMKMKTKRRDWINNRCKYLTNE